MCGSFPGLLIGRTAVHSGKDPAFVAYDQFLSTGGMSRECQQRLLPRFAERNAMESLPDLRPRLHPCGLMLAARITLPHFSVSSAISLPNWAGDPGSS